MKSESIKAISAALAEAQHEIQAAIKDKENPFFRSKYADLASVMAAAKEAIHNHCMAVTQFTGTTDDGKIILTTMLMHTSGEWISSEFPLEPMVKTTRGKDGEVIEVKNNPQDWGSYLTYYRRYTYAALVGVPTADDDGNAASNKVVAESSTGGRVPAQKTYDKPVPVKPEEKSQVVEVKVKDVKTAELKTKTGGKFLKYGIVGSDGKTYGTTKIALCDLAHSAAKDDKPLRITYTSKGQFLTIINAELILTSPVEAA